MANLNPFAPAPGTLTLPGSPQASPQFQQQAQQYAQWAAANVPSDSGSPTGLGKGPQQRPDSSSPESAPNLSDAINSYQNQLINSAGDTARQNLSNDLNTVKQNSSQRGLLYSGINSGNQAAAEGYEGGQLANKIQGINQTTNAQLDQYNQLVATEGQVQANQATSLAQFEAQQQETAYEQALQQQQNNNSFWGNLFGGIAKGVGTAAAVI